MRSGFNRLSWFGLFFVLIVPLFAHAQAERKKGGGKWPNPHHDCSGSCFSAEIISVSDGHSGCKDYEVRISHDGSCRYGLSHATIEMPCGTVKNVQAPGGCGTSFGKDPTTGLKGLKVDGPYNFGKGLTKSFVVKFTWCNSSCQTGNCWEPRVAFKAATCVDIDTVKNSCQSTPTLTATTQRKNATCFGNADGSLSVSAEGGVGPYTYSWSTGCTSSSIENLPAGSYTVTITDSEGTTLTRTEEIASNSQLVLTAVPTNPTCFGNANGAIDLSVTGGIKPYTYTWSNAATTQDLVGLGAGDYLVTVTDSVGCSNSALFKLSAAVVAVTAQTVRPSCNQANGAIDITVTGGSGQYTYQWSNGATSQDITGLLPGSYSVVITEPACVSRFSFSLTVNNTLKVTPLVTPTGCVDNSTGAIDLTVTGGTAPYSYAWQNGATTEDISGLPAGIQRVTVTDAAGCTVTSIINVFKQAFQVASQTVPPNCSGEANGSISLTPNGVAPYTYLWSTGATSSSVSNLASGLYTVTVTDGTGCSQTLNYFISNPVINIFANVTNPQCGTQGSFAIDLTVTGGTGPYSYEWSNGAMTEDIPGLTTGTYTVIVTDANGCTKAFDVIVQPVVVDWSCSIMPPGTSPVCGASGNTLATTVGGPAQYVWSVQSDDSQWVINSGLNASSISYTAGGNGSSATFSVTITKGGCTQTCSFTVAACAPVITCGSSSEPPPTSPSTPPPDPSQPQPAFHLSAFPNPVVDKLSFSWTAEANELVRIEVIDFCGKRVAEVYSGMVQTGAKYQVDMNASQLHDRLYFYRYSSASRTVHGKLFKKN